MLSTLLLKASIKGEVHVDVGDGDFRVPPAWASLTCFPFLPQEAFCAAGSGSFLKSANHEIGGHAWERQCDSCH